MLYLSHGAFAVFTMDYKNSTLLLGNTNDLNVVWATGVCLKHYKIYKPILQLS